MSIKFSPGPCGCCDEYALAIRAGGLSPIGPSTLTLFINGQQSFGNQNVNVWFGQPQTPDDHETSYWFLSTQKDADPHFVFVQYGNAIVFQQSSKGNQLWADNLKGLLKHGQNNIDFFCSSQPTLAHPLAFQIVLCTIIKNGNNWVRAIDILQQGEGFKFPPTYNFNIP